MMLQYFINYNLKKGYYVTSQPIVTANWNSTGTTDAATGDNVSGGTWNVPFGGGIGQIRRLGPQPINWTVQFYGNAVHPSGASPWSFKFQIALLYPKCQRKSSRAARRALLREAEIKMAAWHKINRTNGILN